MGTPFIGISYYDVKIHGFSKMLGLSEYIVDMKLITGESLLASVTNLLRVETEVKRTLHQRVAELRQQAYQLPPTLVQHALGNGVSDETRD